MKQAKLHPRNIHINGYDFSFLIKASPELIPFVITSARNGQTIDFTNSQSVKQLNKALLKAYYQINFWDIPNTYLCPPVPGRVDYIHYLADLLAKENNHSIPTGKKLKVLDIGTGANLIYPLTGNKTYQWHFTASDIDPVSVKIAQQIALFNNLKIDIRLQKQQANIFKNLIKSKDIFDITLCNPPFHSSIEDANKGSERKWKNLNKTCNKVVNDKSNLNFGGQKAELWCPGGELQFIKNMINESNEYKAQCLWFTCLVSKKNNLAAIYKEFKLQNVTEFTTIDMAQGQKTSRFVAWTFYDKAKRQTWAKDRWS
ncbi:23S rRNA (adenine(1618)-N(6))-methyltransferase [Pseudoalteromonas sp. NBT06-2]|uniref:23S rRNA (adenine(1618)-N(6))-methyltransferase RlmF n=1 Tax=Pseudoalteromonas sp. NBT06-2 TaxID=2025950 RepID=UPI000BA656D8|nr:23S rRNA (adenine(1618)-N(6))-methyltransferase RlmF [Pseudoalteromonas sp. NBT06-2]PAJ76195.1 23S rRNA (adenine(1618)-N(6))-methyltransferase [Pseudoalteromonas sp. NBT06-2]